MPVLQLGPLALGSEFSYTRRALAASGQSSTGLIPDHDLTAISGSGGWAVDAQPCVTANVTRGFDIHAAVSIPIRGEDITFFPLEDLTPTRGVTWSGGVELRY